MSDNNQTFFAEGLIPASARSKTVSTVSWFTEDWNRSHIMRSKTAHLCALTTHLLAAKGLGLCQGSASTSLYRHNLYLTSIKCSP